MKRRLFSMMLCAFALLLLMGAGLEKNSAAALMIEEESTAADASAQVLEAGIQTGNDVQNTKESASADQIERFNTALPGVVNDVPETDQTLLVNGVAAPLETGKTVEHGTSYVALSAMAKALDPTVSVSWDSAAGVAVVKSAKLTLIAKVGQQYLEANGRYLYVPEGIWMENGRVVVPLTALTKAFDASLNWNQATGITSITTGSGAIASGESFYNQEDLFWLSRIVYAESGNQPLEGRISVATVVLNRVANPIFPNSVEGVLAQKNQFTTYGSGKLKKRTPNAGSVVAAKLAMDGAVVEETAGALYFDSTANSWASRHKTYIATIGGHKFYR